MNKNILYPIILIIVIAGAGAFLVKNTTKEKTLDKKEIVVTAESDAISEAVNTEKLEASNVVDPKSATNVVRREDSSSKKGQVDLPANVDVNKNSITTNDDSLGDLSSFSDTMKDYNLIFSFRDKLSTALKNGNVDQIIPVIDESLSNNKATLQFFVLAMQNSAVPFFRDFQKLDSWVDLFSAPLGDGTPGYSLYQSIIDKNGKKRPFVLLMAKRNDQMYLTNIFIDTTYEDLHNGQHPREETGY